MKYSQDMGESMVKDPITVDPEVLVLDAQEIMRSWGMRHLPVLDKEKVVGVLSEGDIFRSIAIKGTNQLKVRDAMNDIPFIVSPHVSLKEVAYEMAQQKYECVLVSSEQGKVMGIFTTTDALYILSQLLQGPGDKFRTINIHEYLSQYQKMAI